MPTVLYPPSRPQSIGEVLDLAFRIFRATLLRCLPFGVLAMVAGQLQNIYDIVTRRPLRQFGGGDPVWWVLYGVGAFLAVVCIDVIVLRQASTAAGQSPVARASLVNGLRNAPAAFVVFVLQILAVGVWFLPLGAIPALGLSSSYLTWGIVVLSIPAAYVGIALSCGWAALLLGRKGVFGSLAYSVRLVRGNWWRTVTSYLVALAMLGVLFVSAGVIAAVVIPMVAGGDVAVVTAVSAVMVAVLGAVYVPFFTSVAIALYGDLEARKDGVDLERRVAGAEAG
jgi:hypothetical protein